MMNEALAQVQQVVDVAGGPGDELPPVGFREVIKPFGLFGPPVFAQAVCRRQVGTSQFPAEFGFVGKVFLQGLFLAWIKKNPARMTGRTRCNKIVVFDGSDRHRGQLLDVRIERAGSFTLYADAAVLND